MRKNKWARARVEQLYLDDPRERNRKRNRRRAAMRAHRAEQESGEQGVGEQGAGEQDPAEPDAPAESEA